MEIQVQKWNANTCFPGVRLGKPHAWRPALPFRAGGPAYPRTSLSVYSCPLSTGYSDLLHTLRVFASQLVTRLRGGGHILLYGSVYHPLKGADLAVIRLSHSDTFHDPDSWLQSPQPDTRAAKPPLPTFSVIANASSRATPSQPPGTALPGSNPGLGHHHQRNRPLDSLAA